QYQAVGVCIALFLPEALAIVYMSWNAIRMCLFALHNTAIVSFATRFHIGHLNSRLRGLISRLYCCGKRYKKHRNLHKLSNYLSFIGGQLHWMQYSAQYFNANAISNTLRAAIGTNFGANIWMVTMLVYGPLNRGQSILFLVIASLQT